MSASDAAGPARARPPAWVDAALLAAAFAALFAWTWGRWPDVLVDFGRELYVPWRIVEGQRLFTDLAWFNGPLSPHVNALAFRVFGVALATLVGVNAALFALLLALLHYVLRSCSSRTAATGACLLVMATCGFGQLVGIGNYNFICPYSHEATHGLLLGIAALAALQRGRGASWWTLLGGLCVGLAFLTKPEMFAAALVGAGTALALHVRSERLHAGRALTAFALGALTPIVASYALLCSALPSAAAWRGTLGAWPSLLASGVSELQYYRSGMGLDAPAANALAMFAWAAGLALLLAPGALLAARVRNTTLGSVLAFVISGGAFAALWLGGKLRLLEAARAWPLWALAAAVIGVALALRRRGDARSVGAAAFALFALAALAKMALAARLAHYGFALALPATALVAVALLEWLPHACARRGWSGATFRAGAIALLIGFAALALATTGRIHARKNESVGTGADRFRADVRGRVVNAALAWLERRFPAGTPRPTLAVLPEGVTLNYLARLENPTPYVNFMPPELLLFGEARIVAAFRAHPPDVVLLTHKDTSEYGVGWFGRDYARDLGAWLFENYAIAQVIGDPPSQPGSVFGIAVLTRKQAR